jgi:hypothetical protein
MDHSVRIAAAIYPYLSRNSSFPDCRLIRGAVWAAKHRFAALACANPAPIFDAFCANLRQFMAAFDRFFLMYQRQLKPIFITNTRVKDHISIKQQIRIKFPAPICANYRLRRFAPIRRQSAPIFYGVNFEIILKYRVYFLHFLINYLIVNMRFFADRNIRAFFRNSAPRVAEVIESVTD